MHPRMLAIHHSTWTLLLGPIACSGPAVSAADTTEAAPDTTEAAPDTTGTTIPETTTPTTSTTHPTLTTDSDTATTETTTLPSTGAPEDPSTSSTTDEPGLCGNAIVDPGETCDLGIHNWDHGACTAQCQLAACGDGLIFEGVEACDNSEQNGTGYDQCHPVTCQWTLRCGDGLLTPEFEECDAGGVDGSGEISDADTPCKAGCTWDGRVVFISSAPTDAKLGGITGAELHCQNLAEAAHIDGHAGFRAWLSDADDSPFTRLTFGPERLVMLSGKQVAANLAALISDGPGDGITVTEQRTTLIQTRVWTNTAVNGEIFSESNHCQDWTSVEKLQTSYVGLNAVPKLPADVWTEWSQEKQWTAFNAHSCPKPAHLYCIEDATP